MIGVYGTYQRLVPQRHTSSSPPVIAQITPSIKSEVKQEVPLETPKKTIKVYPQSVKEKLELPKEAIDSATIHLTDSSVIKAQEHPVQVNQVVDTTTGETKTYVANLPSPWLQLESRGYAAIDYGYKRNSLSPVVRLNVREDLLQVKGIHLGVTGSAYSDGDYFVGVGGEYRW